MNIDKPEAKSLTLEKITAALSAAFKEADPEQPVGAAVVQDKMEAPLAFWKHPIPPPPQPAVARAATQPNLSRVCRLAQDTGLRSLANKHGLSIVDVAWEDTSRYKNSCLGSNITDVTLHAKGQSERCSIIRKPNFTDHTGDFDIAQFKVKVGNETGDTLQVQPLRDYLNAIFRKAGASSDVVEESRDILVAAQTCVLPLQHGKCDFSVELFNYQSSPKHPACLAVVCSDKGTSAQVLSGYGAQKLEVNLDGRAADFFAERLKVVREREGRAIEGAMSAQEEGRNVLLVFQVPLKIERPRRRPTSAGGYPFYIGATLGAGPATTYASLGDNVGGMVSMGCAATRGASFQRRGVLESSDLGAALGVDHAQLGVTDTHGSFAHGLADLKFAIDPDAAIRCTVQHYLVSDSGTLAEDELVQVKDTINGVYGAAKRQGSLVVDVDVHERTTQPKQHHLWFIA